MRDRLLAKLAELQAKRQNRKARRDIARHHLAETHKHGYARAARRNGKAMRILRGLISKTRRAITRLPAPLSLENVKIRALTPGAPHWGGGADLMGQFVAPFMAERFGLAKGSGKRTPAHNAAIGGSPTSDHLTTNRTTFARDFPTFDGEAAAMALAAALGWHGWHANSYEAFYVTVDGETFRVQILWGAAIGHGDHVHVGIGAA